LARGHRTRPRDRRLKLLADTHAVLWWLSDDPRLTAPAREAIAAAAEPLFSAGTLFEVSIKASLGKLEVAEEWAEELFAEGFSLLAISTAHAAAYRRLPYVELDGKPQRDPFDRLLVAQAMVEGMPLVTCDPGIAAHGVSTLW
jgi:PIN domain nuclease of toxin-antitoxin system